MEFEKTPIQGLYIIESHVIEDKRGYFMEAFRQEIMEEHLGPIAFVQENESFSLHGVTRGLHYQKEPHAQAKLIRVLSGSMYDVAVDLRSGSPTYGHYFGVELSAENKKQFFIPHGFAHGFCVTGDHALVLYKTDSYYNPQAEGAVRFNSPLLGIEWPLKEKEMILSPKDLAAPLFCF